MVKLPYVSRDWLESNAAEAIGSARQRLSESRSGHPADRLERLSDVFDELGWADRLIDEIEKREQA